MPDQTPHPAEVWAWECGPHANAWNGHDARCRRVRTPPEAEQSAPEPTAPAPVCEHFYAWVSPVGTSTSARLCMVCHQPEPAPESTAKATPTVQLTAAEQEELAVGSCGTCQQGTYDVDECRCDDLLHTAVERILADRLADCPRVEITSALERPTTCKITRRGVTIFEGRDYSAEVTTRLAAAEVEAGRRLRAGVEALADAGERDARGNSRELAARLRALLADTATGGEVGTGAGEGAPRQDTGSAWVTRSADRPEAPAQAHLPAELLPLLAELVAECGRNEAHKVQVLLGVADENYPRAADIQPLLAAALAPALRVAFCGKTTEHNPHGSSGGGFQPSWMCDGRIPELVDPDSELRARIGALAAEWGSAIEPDGSVSIAPVRAMAAELRALLATTDGSGS